MGHFFRQGFSVRKPMWHADETGALTLEEYPGRTEAMRLAGHDFTVVERPIWLQSSDDPNARLIGAEGWKALQRDDDGTLLNVVQDSYAVVQNDVMWDIADAIVNQPSVKYETAGVLKDGAILWVLAYLDEPAQVTGDPSPIYPFVCVSTTHDGSGACRAQATSVRVVCWNTFSAAGAETRRSGREFTFRHTKNVMARISDAQDALRGVRKSQEAFLALSEELALLPVSDRAREAFVIDLLPVPPAAVVSDRVMANVEEARAKVTAILNSDTIPEAHRNTGYGLFQAGIEYLDHLRGSRGKASKFGRSLLRQETAKDGLVKLVRETAKLS